MTIRTLAASDLPHRFLGAAVRKWLHSARARDLAQGAPARLIEYLVLSELRLDDYLPDYSGIQRTSNPLTDEARQGLAALVAKPEQPVCGCPGPSSVTMSDPTMQQLAKHNLLPSFAGWALRGCIYAPEVLPHVEETALMRGDAVDTWIAVKRHKLAVEDRKPSGHHLLHLYRNLGDEVWAVWEGRRRAGRWPYSRVDFFEARMVILRSADAGAREQLCAAGLD